MVKKIPQRNGDDRLPLGRDRKLDDPEGLDQCPTLLDLLSPRFKEDKCTRLGGSLSLRVVGGFYVVRIACPSEQVQATFTLTTLANLETHLEECVRSSSVVWLPDYDSQKKARQDAKG
jgi:hypothetical protein